jgi:hypothetical protein
MNSLIWEVSASNDNLQFEFDENSTRLTLVTLEFDGKVTLFFKVMDDSAAITTDSIIVKMNSNLTSLINPFKDIPANYALYHCFPNPFNPITNIRFGIPKAGEVKIELYNVLGQHVLTLLDKFVAAGYHLVPINAGNLPSGVYFYKIQVSNFIDVRKMVLMK